MLSVTTHEAKTHLSKLLKQIQEGEEIIIKRGDTPVAKLVPITKHQTAAKPTVGTVTSSSITLSEDAFFPLSDEELKEWGL
jgi:prevent-host-death family protein